MATNIQNSVKYELFGHQPNMHISMWMDNGKYVMMRLAHMCAENTLTILGPIVTMIGRTLLGWSLDPSYNFNISNMRWQST